MGLLGGGRLVIVEDVERWKAADVKAISAYLANPAPDTVLALVAAELKKDSALGKACAKAGDVLVYDVPKRRLPEWVGKQFAERGASVDVEAARLLVEIVGEDPEELASEVDKIATWAAGEPVGTAEIQELAAGCAEVPGYELTDAWGRRDLPAALAACQTLLERSGDPVSRTVPGARRTARRPRRPCPRLPGVRRGRTELARGGVAAQAPSVLRREAVRAGAELRP